MENASKALLMAASVLIGVMILSIAAYLFITFGGTSKELHNQRLEQNLAAFNFQFTSYEEKEELTIYDVVAVAGLATETNKYYEYNKRDSVADGKDSYVSVLFINNSISEFNNKYIEKGLNISENEITNFYNRLISKDIDNLTSPNYKLTNYKCTVQISNTTRKSI